MEQVQVIILNETEYSSQILGSKLIYVNLNQITLKSTDVVKLENTDILIRCVGHQINASGQVVKIFALIVTDELPSMNFVGMATWRSCM